MQIIELDASGWRDVLDYYSALKEALGSCRVHGDSPDAWVDSMLYGSMNQVEPPYVIRIRGTSICDDNLRAEMKLLAQVIGDARAWKLKNYGVDTHVSFQIEP